MAKADYTQLAKEVVAAVDMGSYVISDIHGCYDELIRMLEKINLGDSDTLICAGDYIDKGPG